MRAILLAGMMFAATAQVAQASPTTAQITAAAEAEKRGSEIYAYDQAAWHSSDRFQNDLRRSDGNSVSIQDLRGYVVEPGQGDEMLATFYGERDGRQFAVARYRVQGGRVTSGGLVQPDGERNLSLLAIRMIDARARAIAAMSEPEHELCTSSTPNTVVLSPRGDGIMPVYVLSSTTENGMYPAGGHFRFDFDAHGKLVGERRFMKTCFNLAYAGSGGEKPKMLVLTHLLDPQPTEIHAFVSRNIPLPLAIGTVSNNAIWVITDGHIEYSGDFPRND